MTALLVGAVDRTGQVKKTSGTAIDTREVGNGWASGDSHALCGRSSKVCF